MTSACPAIRETKHHTGLLAPIAAAYTIALGALLLLATATGCAQEEPLSLSHLFRAEYFVAPNGSDTNPGTRRRPFRTLEAARDAVRRLDRGSGATVWLREGAYERTQTFVLEESDSGTKEAPITYRAYKNEQVRITGGRQVPPSAVQRVKDASVLERIISPEAREAVRQIDLPDLGLARASYGTLRPSGFGRPYASPGLEMFFNDEPLRLARWPNRDTVRIGKVLDPGSRSGESPERGGRFTYASDRPNLWRLDPRHGPGGGIWLSGLFAYGFAHDTIEVKSIDTESNVITLAQPHHYGVASGKEFNRYYAQNILEEIDEPGEYYIDRQSRILYFYPPGPTDDARITLSLLEEPLVALENVRYVTFRNLTFEAARGIGIYIERGANNLIAGCTLRNLGQVAVAIGRGGEVVREPNAKPQVRPLARQLGSLASCLDEDPLFDRKAGTGHGIDGCDIYNTGAGGVVLGGGDRRTLAPGQNYVRNSHIHHVSRIDCAYRSAVNVDGVGNRIEQCLIHDCPHAAICVEGNDHRIERNEVFDVCLNAHDMGALYMGRDPSARGVVVRQNFWHDIGKFGTTAAVYLDDGASGAEVVDNVFYKAGTTSVLIGGGSDNRVENNIFIAGPVAIHLDNRLEGWAAKMLEKDGVYAKRLSAVRHDRAPYSERYPALANYWQDAPARPKRNAIRRNLAWRCGRFHDAQAQWAEIAENLVTNDPIDFANIARFDFSLPDDSVVYASIPGFKKIAFGEIGLQRDHYRSALAPRLTLQPADALFLDTIRVAIDSDKSNTDIRYTLDGTDPRADSTLYTGAFFLIETTEVRCAAFDSNGSRSAILSARYRKGNFDPLPAESVATLVPGLEYEYYQGLQGRSRAQWTDIEGLARMLPAKSGALETFSLAARQRDKEFGMAFSGFIRLSADGAYAFHLKSSDGSRLVLGDEVVVDHDGLHDASEKSSGALFLKAGVYPIRVLYFNRDKACELVVRYEGPGIEKQPIAPTALLRSPSDSVVESQTGK